MGISTVILMRVVSSKISGGYRRFYEILKHAKNEGIDYIVVADLQSYNNFTKMFPDFPCVIKQFKVYIIDPKIRLNNNLQARFNPLGTIKESLQFAISISAITKREKADLIVYPSQELKGVLASYFSSLFCKKPWTIIFQPGAGSNQPNLFVPSYSTGALNPLNIISHVTQQSKTNRLSFFSKIGLGFDFMLMLKITRKTTVLTVSTSVAEDFNYLAPKNNILPIIPGNGINSREYSAEVIKDLNYQAVFYGRLIPGKGLFDVAEIWQHVVTKLPNAKLAVSGITEDKSILQKFLKEIFNKKLENNIFFLGELNRHSLFKVIRESFLTLNPSYEDAFSLATLESLACGTPVVAYDIPAVRHNYVNCGAVFRCSVGDKKRMADIVVEVLTKMDRHLLEDQAKGWVSNYDWKKVVQAERKAYEFVIVNNHTH